MTLHVQVESDHKHTAYNIHGFHPEVKPIQFSKVAPEFDYVVLAHGDITKPTIMRLFLTRGEVLNLHEKLTALVEELQNSPVPVIDPPEAFLTTPEAAAL